jgi:hypothetical protein
MEAILQHFERSLDAEERALIHALNLVTSGLYDLSSTPIRLMNQRFGVSHERSHAPTEYPTE